VIFFGIYVVGTIAYTSAVNLLRDVTGINFFGWVNDDGMVDAVAYVPMKEVQKIVGLLFIPEDIRAQMRATINPLYFQITLFQVNEKFLHQKLRALSQSIYLQQKWVNKN